MIQRGFSYPVGQVHCLGVGLGAHVCGFTGKHLATKGFSLERITGTMPTQEHVFFLPLKWILSLPSRRAFSEQIRSKGLSSAALDPAGPGFNNQPLSGRLDATDARFVDVIHTDANNPWFWLNLGLQQPIGDVDLYPNGGKIQLKCPSFLQLWTHSFYRNSPVSPSVLFGWMMIVYDPHHTQDSCSICVQAKVSWCRCLEKAILAFCHWAGRHQSHGTPLKSVTVSGLCRVQFFACVWLIVPSWQNELLAMLSHWHWFSRFMQHLPVKCNFQTGCLAVIWRQWSCTHFLCLASLQQFPVIVYKQHYR